MSVVVITGASAGVGRAVNRLAPRIADRYLARTVVDGQQTDIPIAPDRPDYLRAPLPGDRGAHGIFDAQATERSYVWWATKRRVPLALGAAASAALAALAAWRAR